MGLYIFVIILFAEIEFLIYDNFLVKCEKSVVLDYSCEAGVII